LGAYPLCRYLRLGNQPLLEVLRCFPQGLIQPVRPSGQLLCGSPEPRFGRKLEYQIKTIFRRGDGIRNVVHIFQRLDLDIEGYRRLP
jgi:hypothetical protein